MGKKRVERLMQEMGIQALAKRKYQATTDSKHGKLVAENHLNRNSTPDQPNQSWVADITYIWTKEGWLYLATIMDLYSRKIVITQQINQGIGHLGTKYGLKTAKTFIRFTFAFRPGQPVCQ